MLTQIVLPLLFIQVATSSQTLYELRYETTSTTGEDGSVILTCRDSVTADELKVQNVSFWLNRSSEYNQDLRERGYFGTIEPIGCCSIRFSLQQRHEGYYTCGRSSRNDGVHESPPKILISQISAPLRANIRTNFTATSGGTAVLDCPYLPGALLQYYSMTWMNNNIPIATFSNGTGFNSTDPRYSIDRSTFSLIISSVNMTDASEGYRCDVYVRAPSAGDNHRLPPHSGSIKLNINGKPRLSPTTVVVNKEEDQPSFNCTVEYTGPIAPNITWSYISKGVEKNIACKNPNYKIAQNPPQRENGTSILCSTLTFLNLDMIENQDIVVVRCRSGPGAESDAHLVKITGTCPAAASQETASRIDTRSDTINNPALTFRLAVTSLSVSLLLLLLLILIGVIWCSNHCHGLKNLKDTSLRV